MRADDPGDEDAYGKIDFEIYIHSQENDGHSDDFSFKFIGPLQEVAVETLEYIGDGNSDSKATRPVILHRKISVEAQGASKATGITIIPRETNMNAHTVCGENCTRCDNSDLDKKVLVKKASTEPALRLPLGR